MMQFKRFGSRNEIVFSPAFCGSIAAAGKKPMQHGQINGSLDVKVVTASFQQRSDYLLDAALLPEPPKDQLRPDPPHPDSLSLSGGMRIDNGEIFAMAKARTHQRLEPSAGLELIEPAQGPKDLLANLLTLSDAMDNLEILVGAGTFDSEKHRTLS